MKVEYQFDSGVEGVKKSFGRVDELANGAGSGAGDELQDPLRREPTANRNPRCPSFCCFTSSASAIKIIIWRTLHECKLRPPLELLIFRLNSNESSWIKLGRFGRLSDVERTETRFVRWGWKEEKGVRKLGCHRLKRDSLACGEEHKAWFFPSWFGVLDLWWEDCDYHPNKFEIT